VIIVDGGYLMVPGRTRVDGDVAIERDRIVSVGTVSADFAEATRIDARSPLPN